MAFSLKELAEQLDAADQLAAEDLWPQAKAPELIPVVRTIAAEIGDNLILGEAALAWVRLKKQELLLATLNTVYTPEQLAEMQRKLEEESQ